MQTESFENKKDNPGIYIPPPLIYAFMFIAGFLIQKRVPLTTYPFHNAATKWLGIALIISALFFLTRSLRQFFISRNTLITIKPASSLQTTGIYNITRNPMYVGLVIVYLSLTCLIGNWWNVILFPILITIIQKYLITREEKYLTRRFGKSYLDYKHKVRRWL